jgi:hypothetical protein
MKLWSINTLTNEVGKPTCPENYSFNLAWCLYPYLACGPVKS